MIQETNIPFLGCLATAGANSYCYIPQQPGAARGTLGKPGDTPVGLLVSALAILPVQTRGFPGWAAQRDSGEQWDSVGLQTNGTWF